MKRAALIFGLFATACSVWAQKKDPVQWTLTSDVTAAPPGATVPLKFSATIEPGWHIYSLTIVKEVNGPNPTTASVVESAAVESSKIYQPYPLKKLDPTIDLDTEMFEDRMDLWVPVRIKSDAKGPVDIAVQARYQACDDRECLRPVTKTGNVMLTIDPAAPAVAARRGRILCRPS